MILVPARVLASSPVVYKRGVSCTTAGASWNMIGKQFSVPGKAFAWSFLTLGSATLPKDNLEQFRAALRNAGMNEGPPMSPPGSSQPGYHAALPGNEQDNDRSIENVFRALKEHDARFLLVILPTSSAVVYSRVKFWADIKAGSSLQSYY